jgi:D-alanyl-D-alanine carboxypeptidase (penicillin-binding protein 5/6)
VQYPGRSDDYPVQVHQVIRSASLVVGAALAIGLPSVALAGPPVAPGPTSSEISPSAPDPHPPLGGKAPNGAVPGGVRLLARGIIVPTGAPRLPQSLPAASWVLADLDSGTILAARDPHGRYQPASILKTLTAITVLPHLPGRQVVTVSLAAAHTEGSAVGLLAGAKYTVDDLFHAMMLVSGNDAAAALADANGGLAQTVRQMNTKAAQLGAYDTFVETPSGLDGWKQLTSAYDMTLVLRAALDEPRFIAYDRTRAAAYPAKQSKYGTVGAYQFTSQVQNFFDGVPGALVAKTGYTDAALSTFVCAAERHGRRLGIVFLRNKRVPLDQWQQAAALFNWGFGLKPGVEPVGRLDGPIGVAAPLTTTPPSGSAASTGTSTTVPHGAPSRSAAMPTSHRSSITPWLGAVFVLGCGGAVAQQLTRRRARRRR